MAWTVSDRSVSAWIARNPKRRALRLAALAAALLAGLALALAPANRAVAAKAHAAALQTPALKIAVLVTSRNDVCFDFGDVAAIKHFARAEQARLNQSIGVAGRRLALEFLDDQADAKKTVANVRAALADERMLAMIGLTHSGRAKEVFDTAGAEITAAGVPWMSNIAVNSLFAPYPSVFTMRGAQEDDSIPVMAQFMKDMKASRPAFVGIKDFVYITALADGLKARLAPMSFVTDQRLSLKDNKLDPADLSALIETLKQARPDFIFLNIGGSRVAPVLAELEKAGLNPPILVGGRLETLFASGDVSYSGDLYQVAWDGLPDAYSDRVRRQVFQSNASELMFEGRRISSAPGWTNGTCKERPVRLEPDVLSSANLRAISTGMQFADMIAMTAEVLKSSEPATDLGTLRKRLITGFRETYAAGHGAFPGRLENWSFRPSSRAAARTPFIIMHPKSLGGEQLAPVQYVTLRNDRLRQISTLYLDIDLTRAFHIDDREKSFVAEFYLSMHPQKGESIDQIEFANAFLDPQTNSRQVTIRPMHEGGPSNAYPSDMKIYAVSGKFMFNPNFGNYPFDTQRFAIDIRSKSGDAPFIIQPSPRELRDQIVDAEGWTLRDQYVGYDEDFLPVIDAKSHERSVVPFYKGSFVWVMKREATDYFLTVVIPLAFIMIIAYLAIFIPGGHFEAIVTIQVTALLSAVALYIAIPKVNSD